jgi:hypothetical protein
VPRSAFGVCEASSKCETILWLMGRFVSIHDGVANLHNCPRHAMSSSDYRAFRSEAMAAWREIAELGVAA